MWGYWRTPQRGSGLVALRSVLAKNCTVVRRRFGPPRHGPRAARFDRRQHGHGTRERAPENAGTREPENGQAHARERAENGQGHQRTQRTNAENETQRTRQRTDRQRTGKRPQRRTRERNQRTENGQAQVRGREPKHLKKDIKKDRRSPNPKRTGVALTGVALTPKGQA